MFPGPSPVANLPHLFSIQTATVTSEVTNSEFSWSDKGETNASKTCNHDHILQERSYFELTLSSLKGSMFVSPAIGSPGSSLISKSSVLNHSWRYRPSFCFTAQSEPSQSHDNHGNWIVYHPLVLRVPLSHGHLGTTKVWGQDLTFPASLKSLIFGTSINNIINT